jgi:hypothetical protein
MKQKTYNLSILIPVFNDQEVFEELNQRLMLALPALAASFEIE